MMTTMISASHVFAPLLCCLCVGSISYADTLEVPGQYPTIQQAISAASGGDLIEVAAGTYPERISTSGKAITIRGQVGADGVPTSIIDGENGGTVVTVTGGEGPDTVLENLVVQNGNAGSDGGGVYVDWNSEATFLNCHFLNNSANRGGGAFVWMGSTFTGCTFSGNHCTWDFAFNGAALVRGDAIGLGMTMDGCTVTNNTAADPTSYAVFSYMPKNLLVVNSTICGNDCYECNSCSGGTNYVDDECPVACEPTTYSISVNSDLTVEERANRCPCEKEWGSCGSYDGQWAVAYDLSQGVTSGVDVMISCVTYGAWNNGSNTNGTIQLWRDTDGGAPTHPNDDLVLLGTSEITIITGSHVAIFDPPVEVPADTNLVVTMHADWLFDGYLSVGGNDSPSDSQTWYRDYQGFCSGTFRDVSIFGYPDFAWVTELGLELVAPPCPADITNDGIVGGADLSLVLGFWGACLSSDCVADLNGDEIVDGVDLGMVLGAWGSCG